MTQEFEQTDLTAALSKADRAKLRRTWEQGPAVWRFVPGRGSPKHRRKWLGSQGPAEWHDIALNFDYDCHDYSPLHFIASQNTADRATVMSMVLTLDLPALEQQNQRSEIVDVGRQLPQITMLIDLISTGFSAGFYQSGQYRLGHPLSVLATTKARLDALEGPLAWPLPEQAWGKVDGRDHHPAYVWDCSEHCQRLPFDVWLTSKVRPN